MITIVEPKKHIADLWGQQRVKQEATFRQMRYVLRVDHEGKVLLHNVVTGQLVVLSPEEAEAIQALPSLYAPVMEELIKAHYLVPEDYDEHQQVKNLRMVLNRLDEAERYSGITTYTILTTTACNARCYYCYEQGSKTVTMTEQTADDVVDFINCHCGSARKAFLTWFGGEPTVASDRIRQICQGLQNHGIHYQSTLVTNGYLLNEQMVSEAKSLWKLNFVQICVDGTEENYNSIKSYIGVVDNPYQRVMRNVQLLLNADIKVKLRMNFDIGNYRDFEPLAQEVKERFQGNSLLQISAHPIIGTYPDHDGIVLHGSDEWFEKTLVDLHDIENNAGLNCWPGRLPCLNYRKCIAASDYAVIITPEGRLVCCPERFDDDQIIGNLKDGITNRDLVLSWKQIAEFEKCEACVFFPECFSVTNCLTSGYCLNYSLRVKEASEEAVRLLHSKSDK